MGRNNKKKTHAEYIEEVKIKNPTVEIIGEYNGAKFKIMHKCKICEHLWDMYPSDILRGHGCPKCRYKKIGQKQKKTHEGYVKELNNLNHNIEVVDAYIDTKTKIKHKCKICNHEWNVRPRDILVGRGCPECGKKSQILNQTKTNEQYIIEVSNVNPNIEVLGTYIKSWKKILHKCKICGNEWDALPSNIISDHGCKICAYKKLAEQQVRSHDQYILEVNRINPNIEVLGTYVNSITKIKHKCHICNNEWEPTPGNILSGHGCPTCSFTRNGNNLRKSSSDYKKELLLLNPCIELVGEYINTQIKTLHRCKICGHEWHVRPSSLIHGYGCPECAKITLRNSHLMPEEEFIYKLKNVNNDISLISNYNGVNFNTTFKCKSCNNIWETKPHYILHQNSGCPKCSEKSEKSKGESIIKDYLNNKAHIYFDQKRFSGLRGVGGGLLSYDFYVKKQNLLIEYQGRQHYEAVDYFGGEEQLKIQQEHDRRKREYAELHNIELLEIRYDEDANTVLDNYFNNIDNLNKLNSESLETVMPTIAI